jgi:hypothetical protein
MNIANRGTSRLTRPFSVPGFDLPDLLSVVSGLFNSLTGALYVFAGTLNGIAGGECANGDGSASDHRDNALQRFLRCNHEMNVLYFAGRVAPLIRTLGRLWAARCAKGNTARTLLT